MHIAFASSKRLGTMRDYNRLFHPTAPGDLHRPGKVQRFVNDVCSYASSDPIHVPETRGPSLSQQAGAGVILEDLGVADVAPHRVHAPVPRLVGHLS